MTRTLGNHEQPMTGDATGLNRQDPASRALAPSTVTCRTAPRTRVAIIYTHFPHYRDAVFRSLRRSPLLRTRLFYDKGRTAGGIITGNVEDADVHVRTLTLGPLMFQWGFLRHALTAPQDVFIFLGNPYIVTTWIFALILRLRGRRVLYWGHGWINSREEGAKARLRMTFYRLAHGLLTYGERARSLLIARGYPADRIAVIYNSLDYDAQKCVRQTPRPDSTDPHFLCISRLVAEIRIDLAIDALAFLQTEHGWRARLVVVGEGPLRKTLEAQAQAAGVELEFTGAIYDEAAIAERMARCIAVISPGKVGLLAMHALAYGVPVVTHDDFDRQMPEVEALNPGVTGQFFRRDDPASLAEALIRCLKAGRTEDAFRSGIAEVEAHWTPEVQVRLIEDAVTRLGEDR